MLPGRVAMTEFTALPPVAKYDTCAPTASTAAMRSADSISCVVPSLNEEANLRILLPMLLAVLRPLVRRCEIVVVDDGSTATTPALLAEWAESHSEIVYLRSEEHTSELQ